TRIKRDPKIQHIPVIVMTADQSAEVESLRLGAIDFIPKPYPQREVILARVKRTIELSEDRDIIQSTERDSLTRLYTREFFFHYAEQYELHHREEPMDCIAVDISHFHIINERYGRPFGDEVLKNIARQLRTRIANHGGMVCREKSDTFLVYVPHGLAYESLLDNLAVELPGSNAANRRIRLRMGVYAQDDKSVEIERRFDRAKLAADTVRGNFTKNIAIYDDALHESEIYNEQLIEAFDEAIEQRQFKVYYQPKFDIRASEPILASAEALVRWQHPAFGMVSPGKFIPLFEENGMIQKLDQFVWREAAAQIRDWKARFGISLPVSVNVSRVDMYDPNLINTFDGIMQQFALEPGELLLEITESAYTDDQTQIIETVRRLREKGFRIEMDDFGTGYSSLGMISHLPIDALKLDMVFVRSAFGEKRDVRMLELVLDIAACLGVPVIAEGVETQEQMIGLKAMGCDIVQGYYFSRPVPAEEFERFIEARTHQAQAAPLFDTKKPVFAAERNSAVERIAQSLAADYLSIYDVDAVSGRFIEYSTHGGKKLEIARSGEDFFDAGAADILRAAVPEDLARVKAAIGRENLMRALEKDGVYTVHYRVLIGADPAYVSLKAQRMQDKGEAHIVIGISSIDAQVRREQELGAAREMANRDALTGVKSKHAYAQTEKSMNDSIARGELDRFAIVYCDLNYVKRVNDTSGHKAGDDYIRSACTVICNIFKHSPVFRIGGDEFLAILQRTDYENREKLMAQLHESNAQNLPAGVVIACGMAEFRPGEDTGVEAVLERADKEMYADKKALKTRG
ncbi:MAG: EAL domain-containing protein, partial [Oscillospiraceae bacterium]|nr:EAL domain-containing protein [Oscillospiraceae bacterium]